jgi:hypothetical protein
VRPASLSAAAAAATTSFVSRSFSWARSVAVSCVRQVHYTPTRQSVGRIAWVIMSMGLWFWYMPSFTSRPTTPPFPFSPCPPTQNAHGRPWPGRSVHISESCMHLAGTFSELCAAFLFFFEDKRRRCARRSYLLVLQLCVHPAQLCLCQAD